MNNVVKKENTAVAVSTPADLLAIAVEQGADLDKLERLMDMQDRWEASQARKAFNEAMAGFSAAVPDIEKTKQAHNTMYAPLDHILAIIRPVLHDNGLSISWKTAQSEGGAVTVTCCVSHVLGHQECTSMAAAPDKTGSKNDVQAIGSTVTYLERYTMNALLGLATKDQDSDGGSFTITEEQAADIRTKLKEVDGDEVKLCRGLKIDKLEDLPESKLGTVLRNIAKKKAVSK